MKAMPVIQLGMDLPASRKSSEVFIRPLSQ